MKKIFISFLSLAVFASVFYFSSCKTKKIAKTACNYSPTYTADIKPIMDANCMPCHSAEKHKHNFDVSSYEATKESAKAKNFIPSLKHEAGVEPMPMKKDKLSDETIEKISCWIQNGMPK